MGRPHDEFFKFVVAAPDRAGELVDLAFSRTAIGSRGRGRAPQAPRFGPLEHVPKSFVDPKLHPTSSDLLFKTAAGTGPTFVYILFEHKSSVQNSTLLQLLADMTEIWRPFGEHNASHLPHILPIVVYHGRSRWNAPRSFSDYFEGTPPVGHLDPELRPLLLDLSDLSESALSRLWAITRSAVHAFRWMTRKQQRDLRRALARDVLTLETRLIEAYSTALLIYLDAESTPQEERAILDLVGNSPAREVFMTIAEKYIVQGRSEGLEEGRTEGELNSSSRVLVRLLSKRFGLNAKERDLIESCHDLDRLGAALDAFVDADSKGQVLSELERK